MTMQQTPARRNSEQISLPSSSLDLAIDGSQTVTAEPEEVQADVHLLNEATFSQNRDVLAEVIDAAKILIKDLDQFNADQWQVRYPMHLATTAPQTARVPLVRSTTSLPGKRPSLNEQFFSTADMTAASESAELPDQLPILSLPLKIDQTATGPSTLAAVLARMTQQDISNHLHDRLAREQKQLADLKTRVEDKASKVLITGDLNAGKSTFVNALLKRDLMPVDQQPCTTVFCEVLDAQALNNGKEEIHAIKTEQLGVYAPDKTESFATFPLEKLEEVACAEENEYALIKIYTSDVRSSEEEPAPSHETLLSNGQVDIALIDAPGLNRDTISTTALFARQSEIDVVVFVVSAENHFTLSAKEFLWNAARDKAYIFIVVNKFSGIRDKARCQRMVSEQIRQLSPLTYERRDELVHYVDAASSTSDRDESFDDLESSLRSFVLLKRATSKLLPAKHYLVKLLQDVVVVDEYNRAVAQAQFNTACAELEQVKPVYEKLVKAKDQISDAVHKVEESKVEDIKNVVWSRLEKALSFVQQGKLVPASEEATAPASELPYEAPADLPPYPGVLGIFKWAVEVKEALLQSLEGEIRKAEEIARAATVQGHDEILHGLAERFLPERQREQASERVFTPEVMFAKRRRQLTALHSRRGVGSVGLGSGLHGKVDVSILDLLDLERLNPFATSDSSKVSEEEAAGAISVVSIGVGALTMFGSRAVGVRGFVETVARVADVLGSQHARKWAGPVIGVLTAGLAIYIVYDLPRAVPHNIGRKLHASMLASSTDSALQRPDSFVSKQSERISQTSRAVLRACGYELHKRFASALEQSEEELKAVEASKSEAQGALDWLQAHVEQVEKEADKVHGVDLEAHA